MIAPLLRRIAALEAQTVTGNCTCPDNTRVVWPEDYATLWGVAAPETVLPVCERCGGRRVDVHVEYVEHWREATT